VTKFKIENYKRQTRRVLCFGGVTSELCDSEHTQVNQLDHGHHDHAECHRCDKRGVLPTFSPCVPAEDGPRDGCADHAPNEQGASEERNQVFHVYPSI